MRFTGWTALSLVLIVVGIAFWVWMGSTYNNYGDVGVYSIGVTLIGFGVVGTFVSLLASPRASAP
jgi:hypothetical protein